VSEPVYPFRGRLIATTDEDWPEKLELCFLGLKDEWDETRPGRKIGGAMKPEEALVIMNWLRGVSADTLRAILEAADATSEDEMP
jgi:hypothetical protein